MANKIGIETLRRRRQDKGDAMSSAVMANEIEHTNDDLAILKKEIEDLKRWRQSCTLWAARWAGVCAAVMSIASIIQFFWDSIHNYFVGAK